MKIKTYQAIDVKILSMLNHNPIPVWDIWMKFREDVDGIHIIDRRMQSLRKKGLVANIPGKGWVRA